MNIRPGPSDQFHATSQALFERIHDEGVILDTATDTYFGLNQTGTCIWEAMVAGETVDGAAQRLSDLFGISMDLARTDTLALVHELLERHLIEQTIR